MATPRNVRSTSVVTKIPSAVEVLWEIDGGRRVWWPATVSSTQQEGLLSRSKLLCYEAGYGHEASEVLVRFVHGNNLVERRGREVQTLKWRTWKPATSRKRARTRECYGHRTQRNIIQELDILRNAQARAAVEISKLQMELEVLRNRMGKGESAGQHKLETCCAVLRHRLATQIQSTPKTGKRKGGREGEADTWNQSVDGTTRSFLRVSADCDMQTFELLARRIEGQSRETKGEEVQFEPPFHFTQHPGQGTKQFIVMFPSFSALCSAIGLKSLSDRTEMICRHAASRTDGEVIRLLGTYICDDEDDSKPALIFPGRSCGRSDDGMSEGPPLLTALVRNTRRWSREDRRYLSPLTLTRRPAGHRPMTEDQVNEMNKYNFQVTWRRAPEARPRVWSHQVVHSPTVVGKLEIILPCVVVKQRVLCDELAGLLSDEILESVTK